MINFWELNFQIMSKGVIIGQRIKGGIYKPVIGHIPASTVEGAFLNLLHTKVKGFGFFDENFIIEEHVYSNQDRYLKTSKYPIITQYIKADGGKIFISYDEKIKEKVENLVDSSLYIGALKSKGFGQIRITDITRIDESEDKFRQGFLGANIYLNYIEDFKITLIAPKYGYLIQCEEFVGFGQYKKVSYVKSIMQGSLVRASSKFIGEEEYYDE